MKVAISLDDDLFRQADEAASRIGVNRSQLYARALREYLAAAGDDPVTQRLDELADQLEPEAAGAAARHLIDAGLWQW